MRCDSQACIRTNAPREELPAALLNEHDVARITGLSVATIRRWRILRTGPKFLKLNASVRYNPEDLSGWLHSRPYGGELVEAE